MELKGMLLLGLFLTELQEANIMQTTTMLTLNLTIELIFTFSGRTTVIESINLLQFRIRSVEC